MPSDLPPLALLAGGLATRMWPLTESVPKSLLRIDGEPFLAHQLRLLVEQGIKDIVICCGHLGEQVEAFAGNGSRFGCRVRYSYDGDALLGTGGALRRALPLLGESFVVMYGDSYLLADPLRAWKAFLTSRQPALMTVLRNDGRWDASNVEMRAGRIVRYDKLRREPEMHFIDFGLSLMQANVLKAWPECEPFDLAAVMAGLAAEGKLAAHEVHGRFYEIGSPEGLHDTERMLRALRRSRESELLSMAGCEL
jgi:MurNAc alpha-1-phosphate uridylyltransferase